MGKKIIKEYGLLFIISVVLNIWSVAITDKNYPEKIDDGQKFALFFVFLFLNLVNIYYTNKLKTIKEKKLAKIGMVVGLLLTLGIASIKSIEFVMLLIAGLILQGGIGGYIWYIMGNEAEKEEKESMVVDEGVGENMVLVGGGEFMLGSNNGINLDEEKPVQKVYIKSFYISKFPITQKEWIEIMGINPSFFKGDNLPVENVSWNDVQEFITRINKRTGKDYRLPTVAEWEYAAHGGIEREIIASSNGIENCYFKYYDFCWNDSNSDGKTHDVGTKKPNELGIYDMLGNVWEWCYDYNSLLGENYKSQKGGAFNSSTNNCNFTLTPCCEKNVRCNSFGFRLAHGVISENKAKKYKKLNDKIDLKNADELQISTVESLLNRNEYKLIILNANDVIYIPLSVPSDLKNLRIPKGYIRYYNYYVAMTSAKGCILAEMDND